MLSNDAVVAASRTEGTFHGQTITVSTHDTVAYNEDVVLNTSGVAEGAVNIESQQSGVFCNAKTIDAAAASPIGVTLPLARVNPHPGTVE